jgi:Family of unknown function (DUF6153)
LTTTAQRAVWRGALGVVLAGLFGMHGLDSHGMPGIEATHAAMAVPEMAGAGGNEVLSAPAAVHDGDSGARRDHHLGASGDGHGHGLTCMAILAIALLVLLRGLRGRSARRVLWMLTRPVRAPAFMGRDPDPPSLIALSIQRC